MKKGEFTPLKDLLPKTVNQYNLGRQVRGSLVCHHFRKLARELWHDEIADVMRPASYRDGVLTVIVADSGWAQQAHFKKMAILERLEEVCPDIPIKSLRIKVGSF